MQMLNPFCGVDRDPRGVVRLTICNAGSLNILGSAAINGVREGLETLAADRQIRVLVHYYLNLAVYLTEDFLKNTKDPYYAGSFDYGRPLKGHGKRPATAGDMIRQMADAITKNASAGEPTSSWKY